MLLDVQGGEGMTTWRDPVGRDRPTLFDWGRNERWEHDVPVVCPVTRKACRHQPCTAAQDVDCCADCMACGNPCRIARAMEGL